MAVRFADISLITEDVLKLCAFYETVFESKAGGDETHSFIDAGGVTIVFDHAASLKEYEPFHFVTTGGMNQIILSFDVDDVDEEYWRLLSLEVKTLNRPTTHSWGARSFQFRDPDGNILNFRSRQGLEPI